MSEAERNLWEVWYWLGRLPAILVQAPIDWPKMPDRYYDNTTQHQREGE